MAISFEIFILMEDIILHEITMAGFMGGSIQCDSGVYGAITFLSQHTM